MDLLTAGEDMMVFLVSALWDLSGIVNRDGWQYCGGFDDI